MDIRRPTRIPDLGNNLSPVRESVRSVETLYEHRDGSLVVFVEGKPVVHAPRGLRGRAPNVLRSGVVSAGPH